MKRKRILAISALVIVLVLITGGGIIAYRTARLAFMAKDFKSQVRYLIENGETIGESPAAETFSADYLEAIFGDNPELLQKLKNVVRRGLSEEPELNLGEVSAMIVTYHKETPDSDVDDVVAHAIGGFPLGKRRPGFHRKGYFSWQLDNRLWNTGNIMLGFLGRDMVIFAEEDVAESQQALIESLFDGNIMLLVERLDTPMYYTAVLPDPRRIIPSQLKSHVQAVVLKGSLGYEKGHFEMILLCPSIKSAEYALSVMEDMKTMANVTLKTRFSGVVKKTEWGDMVDTWWALEMSRAVEATKLKAEQNLVRAKSNFGRVMVNAVLKTVERMCRDLAQMRGSLQEGLDPRIVKQQMGKTQTSHYWSDPHIDGPDWPIPPPEQLDPSTSTNAPSEPAQPIPEPSPAGNA